jgi:hypothetical protein
MALSPAAPAAPGAPDGYARKATWAETMAAARAARLQSPAAATAPATGLAFEPFDSGLMPGDGPARQVSVNVSGLETIRLLSFCEQGAANCNIWGEPTLIAKDGTQTKLGSLQPAAAIVGWAQVMNDKNWKGHPLRVGERQFAHGLWVHANSIVTYDLKGKFERFEAWVGEDKDRPEGVLRFQVLAGKAPQPPAVWYKIAADFPRQAGWLMGDLDDNRLVGWFATRPSADLESALVGHVLDQVGPAAEEMRKELQSLQADKAPAGDARWLDLYARGAQARAAVTAMRQAGPDAKAALEKQLAALLAAKATPEDPRWAQLLDQATNACELDTQFEALKHDLANRGHFARVAKEAYRNEALILEGDRDPLDVVLRRTAALTADLKRSAAAGKLDELEKLEKLGNKLAEIQARSGKTPVDQAGERRKLYFEACELRRRIALSNPLLDFANILFIKRHRALYNHMCDQFYGMAQQPGGGLYVLEGAFGPSPRVRDVLADSTVADGRLKGQRIWGGPPRHWNIGFDGEGNQNGEPTLGGSFLSPSLSYDSKTILFAYVECQGDVKHRHHTDPNQGHWAEGRCYHVFKVNTDGSNLTQLTDGTWNDFDPAWLPNGRVAFISERRGGYLRCGRTCPTYTLYDMAADGGDINCLSFHETNEWNPSVTNDGRIIYTRWDYVDRFGCTAHLPWITSLDGSDSRAVHGNFAPREKRPDMELGTRAIPNSPLFVATAAPHHSQYFGSLVIINPDVQDDDAMSPVRRLTPEVGFPESQGGTETYGQAWPLSENYFLCSYDAGNELRKGGGNYGLYLVDCFGNKELIYRDSQIACMCPMPLRATPTPPVSPAVVAAIDPAGKAATAHRTPAHPNKTGQASVAVVNVYDSLRPWPEGTKIKSIRVLQILPMSVPSGGPPHETGARIAMAGDSVVPTRYVLGTVPVEEDGSAHFVVPANREMFFQALDDKGLAVQSMRSATYMHEGERVVCAGCHEPRDHTPGRTATTPLAMRRSPTTLGGDVDGSNPFSYPRLVQPVLDRNCVPCHTKAENADKKPPNLGKDPISHKWYASYNSLIGKYAFTSYGNNLHTVPGQFGAKASKLYQMLAKGHHDLKLSDEDLHRITLWLDCASMFYGVYEKEGGEAQLRGEIAKPTLE